MSSSLIKPPSFKSTTTLDILCSHLTCYCRPPQLLSPPLRTLPASVPPAIQHAFHGVLTRCSRFFPQAICSRDFPLGPLEVRGPTICLLSQVDSDNKPPMVSSGPTAPQTSSAAQSSVTRGVQVSLARSLCPKGTSSASEPSPMQDSHSTQAALDSHEGCTSTQATIPDSTFRNSSTMTLTPEQYHAASPTVSGPEDKPSVTEQMESGPSQVEEPSNTQSGLGSHVESIPLAEHRIDIIPIRGESGAKSRLEIPLISLQYNLYKREYHILFHLLICVATAWLKPAGATSRAEFSRATAKLRGPSTTWLGAGWRWLGPGSAVAAKFRTFSIWYI